jgi:hypothetical protein
MVSAPGWSRCSRRPRTDRPCTSENWSIDGRSTTWSDIPASPVDRYEESAADHSIRIRRVGGMSSAAGHMGGVPFVTDAPVFCSATDNRIRGRVDRAVRGVVVDRGEPVASCLESHGDGTAGENDCGSGLAATVPARAMGEASPGRREPRWHGSGVPCRLRRSTGSGGDDYPLRMRSAACGIVTMSAR